MTEAQFVFLLLHFESREVEPRLRPDPCHFRELAARVCAAFSVPSLDAAFAARLREAIAVGLCRLDALPRTDPFWHGTNRRPTILKVRDLAKRHLEGEPKEWACWAYAATSLLWCDNDFGLPGWQGLHELGALDAAWPTHAAFHVQANSGYLTAPALAQFLQSKGIAVPTWALDRRANGAI